MSIVNGVIYIDETDGKARFVMTSGRMYAWAYGAWRFHYKFVESAYKILRSEVGKKGSKFFLASSSKVFMDKRVAFDPIDYRYFYLTGRRTSKSSLLSRDPLTVFQHNIAVAQGK